MLGHVGIAITILGTGLVAQADPASKALFGLLEYGVLGIGVVLLAVAYIRKDRQVNALYIRLVEKAEKDANKYHELAEALNDTLQELADAIK